MKFSPALGGVQLNVNALVRMVSGTFWYQQGLSPRISLSQQRLAEFDRVRSDPKVIVHIKLAAGLHEVLASMWRL